MGGVIYSANDLIEPGVVLNHTPGDNMLVIGEANDSDSERVRRLRGCLEACGMSSPPPEDVRTAMWNKAVRIIGNSSVCLLADAALDAVRGDAALKELLARALAEGRAIASAYGFDSERAPPRPSGGHASGSISHKPSLVQDYDAGKPMEVEAQFLTPMSFAREAGVPTPTLDVLTRLAAFKAAAKGLYP